MPQTIRAIMTDNPIALASDRSAVDAARVMRDHHIGTVLVSDGDQLSGIVTDRDLVLRAVADGKDLNRVALRDLCTDEVLTVTPDASVDDVIQLMRERAIRRMPVVEHGKPVGIVSLGDLAMHRDRDSLLGDISAAPTTDDDGE